MDDGLETSFRNKEVSLSSSDTKTLASPLEFEKNMIIHNNSARMYGESFSSPIENFITEITTMMNMIRAFRAYLVLSSDLISFPQIANACLIMSLWHSRESGNLEVLS